MTPEERAKRSAAAMWSTDVAAHALEMALVRVAPGQAVMTMAVRPEHLNGHGICHGGYIFTLADSACAIVSNSRNVNMVLQSSTITYLNAARLGDRLTAVGEEQKIRGRSGVIDVAVSDQDGTLVALFRGLVRGIPGHTLAGYAEDNPA